MCLIQAFDVHTQQYFFSGLVSDSMWPKNDEIAKTFFRNPKWIAPLYGGFHIQIEAELAVVR